MNAEEAEWFHTASQVVPKRLREAEKQRSRFQRGVTTQGQLQDLLCEKAGSRLRVGGAGADGAWQPDAEPSPEYGHESAPPAPPDLRLLSSPTLGSSGKGGAVGQQRWWEEQRHDADERVERQRPTRAATAGSHASASSGVHTYSGAHVHRMHATTSWAPSGGHGPRASSSEAPARTEAAPCEEPCKDPGLDQVGPGRGADAAEGDGRSQVAVGTAVGPAGPPPWAQLGERERVAEPPPPPPHSPKLRGASGEEGTAASDWKAGARHRLVTMQLQGRTEGCGSWENEEETGGARARDRTAGPQEGREEARYHAAIAF